MSYDLMVFDPGAAPVEREAFLAWYEQQMDAMDCGGGLAATAPALSAWYADMCKSFPDLQQLNAQDVEDEYDPRMTDYSIGRSFIYAGFRWSEAETAYATVHALAARHGVGFFNPSSDAGEIWLPPAGRSPDITTFPELTLSLEGLPAFASPSAALIEAAADWLNPDGGPGFLLLEHHNENYAQAGGGKGAFTAEWREYSGSSHRHWVAGLPGGDTETTIRIPGNGRHFAVRANEKLSAEDVKTILLAFARNQPRPESFVWLDITAEI